jgi:hypothetical protein
MLRPAGDDVLKVWPVSRHVTSPTNNGAELLEGGTFEPDGGDGYLCVAEINVSVGCWPPAAVPASVGSLVVIVRLGKCPSTSSGHLTVVPDGT